MLILGFQKHYIISPPPDARGIHASCSSSSVVSSSSLCNLLVHSSSHTNGNMATSCAWVTKIYACAWPCSWP